MQFEQLLGRQSVRLMVPMHASLKKPAQAAQRLVVLGIAERLVAP
jgi:hypothetical protein